MQLKANNCKVKMKSRYLVQQWTLVCLITAHTATFTTSTITSTVLTITDRDNAAGGKDMSTGNCSSLDSLSNQLEPSGTGSSLQQAAAVPPEEDGFGLFFQSNREEMLNRPVNFRGLLPDWLIGTFVRNGLGMFENGDRAFLHAFDGFAKLAKWRFFGNQTVLFSTRFIRSNFYKDSLKSKTIAPYLLFQSVDPPFGYLEKLLCMMRGIDNMNVNIYSFRNRKNHRQEYAALSDFWLLYKIDLDKLSTKHRVVPKIQKSRKNPSSLESTGFLNLLSSAHPLPEPGTYNHLNFLSSVAVLPWASSRMNLVRVSSLKRRSLVAQWSLDRIPYMHSFSVTRTRAILLASPFYVNVYCMGLKAEPFSCLDWYPNDPATLYVVELRTGQLTTISIPNIFAMHHVNAFDLDNATVVMHVSSYPSPDFVRHLQLHELRDPVLRNSFDSHALLKRIVIDLKSNNATVNPVDSTSSPRLASLLDMPVINEAYRSRHYCFVYGLVLKTDNVTLSKIAIVKKDLCQDGLRDRIWQVDGHYPVEPWFVARPGAQREDDGVLLVPVLDGGQQVTYLAVLEAQNLTLVSRGQLPTNIPYSLHGRFFPDA